MKRCPVAETYEEVAPIIQRLCRKYSRKPQHYEELLSFCNLEFMRIYETFDPERGVHFAAYLVSRLSTRIIDHIRSISRFGQRSVFTDNLESLGGFELPTKMFLYDLEQILSEESYQVVEMVIREDKELSMYVRFKKNKTPSKFKSALRECLSDRGHSRESIRNIFEEIEEAIKC